MSAAQRGFSLRYEDHQGLLRKMAGKMYGRLQGAGVTAMEYEDVLAELAVAFTLALKGYKPEKGISFSAYFGACCYNRFNKIADKLIREQMSLGLVSTEDLATSYDNHAEDEDSFDLNASTGEDGELSPEDIMERKQDFWENLNRLSPKTRQYVAHLMGKKTSRTEPYEQEEARAIRDELKSIYGVAPNQLRL